MKKIFQEFKEFAFKGNVVDLAVAVVIGGAFGNIVNSLVNDLIMPLFGVLLGKINFNNLFFALDGNHYASVQAATEAKVGVLNYGSLLQNIVNFLIIAFCIFLAVKAINKVTPKKHEESAPAPRLCPYCKTEVAEDATRCPHCTSYLEEAAEQI